MQLYIIVQPFTGNGDFPYSWVKNSPVGRKTSNVGL